MREILFRGRRVDNGEWVIGDLCHSRYFKKAIAILSPIEYSGAIRELSVIPSTIGQYTGLTDRNGEKIFEGDIAKRKWGEDEIQCIYYVVEFNAGEFNPANIERLNYLGFWREKREEKKHEKMD